MGPTKFSDLAFLDKNSTSPDDWHKREHLFGHGVFKLFGVEVVTGTFDKETENVSSVTFWWRSCALSWNLGHNFGENFKFIKLESFTGTLNLFNSSQERLWVEKPIDKYYFHVFIGRSGEFFELATSVREIGQPGT